MNQPAASTAFRPPALLGNTHLQSMLANSPLRRALLGKRSAAYAKAGTREVIRTPSRARLLAVRTPPPARARALIIMLHGWEGSADSGYMLALGDALWRQDFMTVRLNFRDHGDSHYLNHGLFHSCLLDEVAQAIEIIATDTSLPVFLLGFSLGGNFALRTACRAGDFRNPLRRVYAISPVIIPKHVMQALEHGLPLYEHYFMRKWRRSLRKKQAMYPEIYPPDLGRRRGGIFAMTRTLIEQYTEFDSIDDYLEGYAISGDYLRRLAVPAEIIAARDDPIIPAGDFASLPDHPHLAIELHEHGGHCGFICNWRLHSWLEHTLAERINKQLATLNQDHERTPDR